ncbi:MAG: metallophosphoesterase [Acidobacteriota bacterium]
MSDKRSHFEEYIYLAGLTHNAAFIGWGGFEFRVKGNPDDEWAIADDLVHHPQRRGSIGVNSPPLAEEGTLARIELTNKDNGEVTTQHQAGANRFHVRDLTPGTEYTYRIFVKLQGEADVREWGTGPLRDWEVKDKRRGLRLAGNSYKNEFRTFPQPDQPAPDLTLAIIGDFGRGVRKPGSKERCQQDIADALKQAVEDDGVRFILTTGDNVYHGGSNDDDWFFTYFQPYRYVINRIPVYPTVGNHDDGEDESNDDRAQIYDNFFIIPRFTNLKDVQEASTKPGLFYRFRYGSDIEFICLDTSRRTKLSKRYFRRDQHKEFIDHAFSAAASPRWRIPFSHHPPYSAGPRHHNTDSMIEFFIESGRLRTAGVRVLFSGHEHNFQHTVDEGINYFVTGGAGEIRTRVPSTEDFGKAKTTAWGGNEEGHFLLVKINGDRMEVTPRAKRGPNGEPRVLEIKDIHRNTLEHYAPIEIRL